MPNTTLPDTLRRRLLLYAAAALLLMAAWVAGTVSLPLLENWKDLEKANLLYKAQFKAQVAGEWLSQHRHVARQFASRTGMRQEQEALKRGEKTREEVVAFLSRATQDFLRQSPDVIGLVRLDEQGRVLIAGGTLIPEEQVSLPAPEHNKVRISGPLELGGITCLLLSTPVHGRDGAYLGGDVMAVGTEGLRSRLGEESAALGMTSGNGARWLWVGRGETMEESGISNALHLSLHGESGIAHTQGRVIAYAPVPDAAWGLILPMKTTDLYAPAWANLHVMFGYVGLVYVLCLAGFLILSRPLAGKILIHTHELEENIAAKTRQLQEELAARIRAERDLEVARDELEDRVRSRTYSLAEANMALREEQTRRKELSRELINMLEEMRLTISRDLHDHTGQLLTTLRLTLETVRGNLRPEDDSSAERLHAAGETVKTIQRTVKDIAKGLRPPCLDYLGLLPSLENMLDEYRQTGLKVIFFHKDIPETLDKERALALYRIAQEALTNVLRHAEAHTVHVNFTLQNTMLTLSIEDDGRGFDAEAMAQRRGPMDHLGLTLMRERATLLDGDCIIDSFPGRGTQIIVQIPNVPEGI